VLSRPGKISGKETLSQHTAPIGWCGWPGERVIAQGVGQRAAVAASLHAGAAEAHTKGHVAAAVEFRLMGMKWTC
jgi:hypothetical protein